MASDYFLLIEHMPKRAGDKLSSVNTEGCGFASKNAIPIKELAGSETVTHSGKHLVAVLVLFI